MCSMERMMRFQMRVALQIPRILRSCASGGFTLQILYIMVLLTSVQTAYAAFFLSVQTNTSALTRVDGQPANIVDQPNRVSAASQGKEESVCQVYGRKSAASAIASAAETGRTPNSVSLALSSTATANGGHYRTCGYCLAQQCVGIQGHDSSANAEATATASVLVKFEEITLPGRYRLTLAVSRSGAINESTVELLDATGKIIPAETDGAYIIEGDPGAIYRVVARTQSMSEDRGSCCSAKRRSDLRFEVKLDRMAEMAGAQVPFILGGKFTTGYPQVGLLTLQALDGSVAAHCTGTLIGQRTVLTAAHCVADDVKSAILQKRMRFLLGTSIDDAKAERFVVAEARIPDKVPFVFKVKKTGGDITTEDDIALIYLDKRSKSTPLPIYRGAAPTLQSLIDSAEPIPFVGFGLYSIESDGAAGSGAGKKRAAFVEIQSQDKRTFGYSLNANGQGVCRGDSGGPALVETPPQGTRVLGVTAYGAANCTTGRSTRVEAFVDWIDPLIKN